MMFNAINYSYRIRILVASVHYSNIKNFCLFLNTDYFFIVFRILMASVYYSNIDGFCPLLEYWWFLYITRVLMASVH